MIHPTLRSSIALLAATGALVITGCDRPAPQTEVAEKTPSAPASNPMPTPQFIQAALDGKLDVIQNGLAIGTAADACAEDGRTALMLAAFNGHTAIVEALLKAGADVNAADEIKRTALMYASTGPNLETVKALLKAGADINLTDGHENWTPLMFAAAEGHGDIVVVLLDHKADPTLKDTDGDSAAAFARQRGHNDLAKLLQTAEEGK